jgi:hypothetical protein
MALAPGENPGGASAHVLYHKNSGMKLNASDGPVSDSRTATTTCKTSPAVEKKFLLGGIFPKNFFEKKISFIIFLAPVTKLLDLSPLFESAQVDVIKLFFCVVDSPTNKLECFPLTIPQGQLY